MANYHQDHTSQHHPTQSHLNREEKTYNFRSIDSCTNNLQPYTSVLLDHLVVGKNDFKDASDYDTSAGTNTCSSEANDGGFEFGSNFMSGWMSCIL